VNIYVGNLSLNVTEDELKTLFSEFGELDSVKIITDKFTGKSRGFGFVEMSSDAEAQAAIEALNEQEFQGQAITVNEARPKAPREDRGGGGRYSRGGPGGGGGGGRDRRGGGGRSGGGRGGNNNRRSGNRF
jgi:RNA recognition motif-containing protein